MSNAKFVIARMFTNLTADGF